MKVCKFKNCGKPVEARQMCRRHYQKWRRNERKDILCSVEKCTIPPIARGLCQKHYHRLMKHGTTNDEFGREFLSKQKCKFCKKLFKPQDRWQKFCSKRCYFTSTKIEKCTIKGCNNHHEALGFCSKHYNRFRKHGSPFKTLLPRKGYSFSNGYKMLPNNGRQIAEHRKVMEEHLGRKLKRNEFVHHINEIRDDNRLENLQIVSNSQNQKFHKKFIRKG